MNENGKRAQHRYNDRRDCSERSDPLSAPHRATLDLGHEEEKTDERLPEVRHGTDTESPFTHTENDDCYRSVRLVREIHT